MIQIKYILKVTDEKDDMEKVSKIMSHHCKSHGEHVKCRNENELFIYIKYQKFQEII